MILESESSHLPSIISRITVNSVEELK